MFYYFNYKYLKSWPARVLVCWIRGEFSLHGVSDTPKFICCRVGNVFRELVLLGPIPSNTFASKKEKKNVHVQIQTTKVGIPLIEDSFSLDITRAGFSLNGLNCRDRHHLWIYNNGQPHESHKTLHPNHNVFMMAWLWYFQNITKDEKSEKKPIELFLIIASNFYLIFIFPFGPLIHIEHMILTHKRACLVTSL